MFDFQRMFHTGRLVPDLAEAMALYGRSLNLQWAEPFTFDALPLWTPGEGLHHLRLEVTYSCAGPLHLEIQKGPAGSFYDPALSSGEHTGFWVDSVPQAVARLEAQGWGVVAAGAAPQDGLGLFAYLRHPAGGMLVEVVSPDLQPVFAAWWAGEGTLG